MKVRSKEQKLSGMLRGICHAATLWVCVSAGFSAQGAELSRDGKIVGKQATYVVGKDESLLEIARRFDIGSGSITAANPGVDPFVPGAGRTVIIPSESILPDASAARGIVINIAEMRLYLLTGKQKGQVLAFPVGIGDEGKDTPVGFFTIIEKIKNPAWHVPTSILAEKPYLPPVVPPGPDNPLGSRALRLSDQTVLIHGTDRPWGIGTRDSHGCIRLYEEDIVRLFDLVRVGTPVTIVSQPVKAAVKQGVVYLEVHDSGDSRDLYREALKVLGRKRLLPLVNLEAVKVAAREKRGLVVPVTR